MESLEPRFPSRLPLETDFDVEIGSSKKISFHAACDKNMCSKKSLAFQNYKLAMKEQHASALSVANLLYVILDGVSCTAKCKLLLNTLVKK